MAECAAAVSQPSGCMNATPVESLDIVVPVYNEEKVIDLLVNRLADVFSAPNRASRGLDRWRVTFVDDGSTDGTVGAIRRHIASGFPATCIRLSRNFGHQAAVSAGLDHADADAVAVIDADLQDPPELLWDMVDRLREGYDVVYGQRMNRTDPIAKRVGSWIFYRMATLLSEVPIPLDSGDFCVMRARVVGAMRSLPERLRFPRILRAWVGFRQVGLAYSRPERAAGRSNYSWQDLYRLATDGIASASIRPLRLAQVFAWSYMALTLVVLAVMAIGYRGIPGSGRLALFLLLVMNVSGLGLVMFCIYIVGAYLGRMYLEVKARPTYIVMEIVPTREPGAVVSGTR
jgi:glycosyltransferase involved in cell wall biosynthesis